MHQFVVSNHMLTSHIATLAYYVVPQPLAYADPVLYQPVVDAMLVCLEDAVAGLKGTGQVENPGAVVAREDLRLLNDQLNTLVAQRKAELDRGIIDSDTRRKLSRFKPVVDQFNFIAKVVTSIQRLSRELSPSNYSRPASHGPSLPTPS
jgi:hypothetical protein